jgi:hypothetical protein
MNNDNSNDSNNNNNNMGLAAGPASRVAANPSPTAARSRAKD